MLCSVLNLRALLTLAIFVCVVLSYTPNEKKSRAKEKMRELRKQYADAKRANIRIESITECDQKDILPNGCRDPVTVIPSNNGPRYIEWHWEKRYTITWGNVDDDYAQQFEWKTDYCGSVNKTLSQGQRSFDYTFKDLAADFPKSSCNYSMEEFRRQANSATNDISVQQPEKPVLVRTSIGFFPILDDFTNNDVRRLRYGVAWDLHDMGINTRGNPYQNSNEGCNCNCSSEEWLNLYPRLAALGFLLMATASFYGGIRFATKRNTKVD